MSEKSVLDIDINTPLIHNVGKTSPVQAVQCSGATKVLSFQQFSDQILTQTISTLLNLLVCETAPRAEVCKKLYDIFKCLRIQIIWDIMLFL
jgi:hypothetical protein